MKFQLLPQPIVAKRLYFSDITYTADPAKDQTVPLWNDGHIIQFEIELFGCENYQIDAGKHWSG